MIMTILTMVFMFYVFGFVFRICFGIFGGFLKVAAFLTAAVIVTAFTGILFLPVIAVIGLIVLVCGIVKNA